MASDQSASTAGVISRSAPTAATRSSLPLLADRLPQLRPLRVYRYDAVQGTLDCASCAPTGAPGASNALAARPHLTDDGRVFFTTQESLHPARHQRKDGRLRVGRRHPADLHRHRAARLGPAHGQRDGKNAFFFTRDILVPDRRKRERREDLRRPRKRRLRPRPPHGHCAASDECHGPGTEAPPPPNINTVTPTNARKPVASTKKNARSRRC